MARDINTKKLKKNAFRYSKVRGETASRIRIPGGVIDAKGVDSALEILEALPPDAADVGEINVSDPQSICLYTVSGVQIKLGDSSGFEEKYLVYSNILADHKANGGKMIEYIDVSIPEDPAIKYLDI